MVKCEVLVDRCSLVVGKGSIVNIDNQQYELARAFVKPVDLKVEKVEEKPASPVVEEKKTKKSKK